MKIELKKEVEKVIEKRIKQDNQFSSVQEYIDYILNQVVEKLNKEREEKEVISEESEKEVEKQLRNLGYLD